MVEALGLRSGGIQLFDNILLNNRFSTHIMLPHPEVLEREYCRHCHVGIDLAPLPCLANSLENEKVIKVLLSPMPPLFDSPNKPSSNKR
jgi:hypothetical protein